MSQGSLHAGDPWAASAAARMEAWRQQEYQEQQSQETTENSWQDYGGVPEAYYEEPEMQAPFVGVSESMLPQQQRSMIMDHDKPPQWDGKDPHKKCPCLCQAAKDVDTHNKVQQEH